MKTLRLFRKSGQVKVIPVSLKIILLFAFFILVSNLVSNYITLVFDRTEQVFYSKQLLIKDLKDLYSFSNIQWEIVQLSQDREAALASIKKRSLLDLKNNSSLFLGIQKNGIIQFIAQRGDGESLTVNPETLAMMNQNLDKGIESDFIQTIMNGRNYFGIYKYNAKWDFFLFRGEDNHVFFEKSRKTFQRITWIIICMTLISTVTGIFIIRYILRYIGIITEAIMDMGISGKLAIIPLKQAPNDDVTYMGMAFNSLSDTTRTLIRIFRKFTNEDIVKKAYQEKNITLEGNKKDLTILFTDIKEFTGITEVLGLDIIQLINMYYDEGIQKISVNKGIIASIIGDALLAVFGVMPTREAENKSLCALLSAYELHGVADTLRLQMLEKKNEIILRHGELTPEENRIFNAVMIDIGVGIDGGEVFYGTIGSRIRMTNTVIGDPVNSASRLEGLTRLYKVPVICSEYVKNDIELHVPDHPFAFIFMDRVTVKGKAETVDIYWPVKKEAMTKLFRKNIKRYQSALSFYLDGKWEKANKLFSKCTLPMAAIMVERTGKSCPSDWKGIWILTNK